MIGVDSIPNVCAPDQVVICDLLVTRHPTLVIERLNKVEALVQPLEGAVTGVSVGDREVAATVLAECRPS